uniref:Early endosome antigen 1 n=1 Tax=Ascaris suum TaxID=6253 RepID=F1KRM2_ASCSU
MLRKLRQQVTQAVNAVNSNESRHETLINEEDGNSEGFLCPLCMRTFISPEELQTHFAMHSDNKVDDQRQSENSASSSFSLPTDVGNAYNGVETLSTELEVKELRSSIRDEKRYSAELKKELERLHAIVASQTQIPEGEVPYLMQQVQMLEAGKSMVTQRMLEMEKELSGMGRQNETLRREKSEIVAKLGELTAKITAMTDELEEKQSEKAVLGNELIRYREEIQHREEQIENLVKQLDQRPSEDDVSVLRRELVHAQQLMDKITQEKVEEISEHLTSIRNLTLDRQHTACIVQNLEEQVAKLTEKNSALESELNSAKLSLNESKINSEQQITNYKKENDELTMKLMDAEKKVVQMERLVAESRDEIERSVALNESNVSRLAELQTVLDQMVGEKARYDEDMRRIEEEREREIHEHSEALERIATLQKSASSQKDELIEEVAKLNDALEKEKKLCAEKKMSLESKCEALEMAEEEIKKLKEEMEKRRILIEELSLKETQLKANLVASNENAKLLMQKISEGEGGAKLAMDQMGEEKRKLVETVENMELSLKQLKESHQKAIEEKEREWKDKSTEMKARIKALVEELEKLQKRYSAAEKENKRKSERYAEMERDHEEECDHLHSIISEKENALNAANAECVNVRSIHCEMVLSKALEERNRLIDEKEKAIRLERDEIEDAVKKLALMEEKARLLSEQLNEEHCSLTNIDGERKVLEAGIEAKNNEIAALNKSLISVKSELREKERDIDDLRAQFNAQEVHLKSRITELEKMIGESVENNDELMSKISEMQKAAAESDKNMKNNLEVLQERTMEIMQQSTKISHLEESLTKLENAKLALEHRCTLQAEQLTTAGKERDRLNDVIAELNGVIREKASSIKELEDKLEKANIQGNDTRREFEMKLSALEAKVIEAQKTTCDAISALEQKQQEVSKRDAKICSLEESLQSKDIELGDFAERLRLYDDDLSEKRRAIEKLEGERLNLEKRIAVEIQKFEQVVSEKTEQETSLREEIVKLNGALSTARTNIANLEREKKSQEECTLALKKNLESENAATKARFTAREREYEVKIKELNEELASEKNELQAQMAIVLEKDQQLRDANAQLEMAHSATQHAEAKCTELEKKALSWTEEKKALLERCLNSESDLDFERERAAENKRRFDDALSAMHELGRANQSLQMDISKQFNRKWLDDSEAVNCNLCGKAFSLTIRKHHCRQCGLIFCGQCSSRTASVPSHKNPVRVCNSCHEDISNR